MTCCKPQLNKEYNFTANYRTRPISEKFYAYHDRLDFSKNTGANVQMYAAEIARRSVMDPRDGALAPRTENQVYGWLERQAVQYTDDSDKVFMYHHRRADPVIAIMREVQHGSPIWPA